MVCTGRDISQPQFMPRRILNKVQMVFQTNVPLSWDCLVNNKITEVKLTVPHQNEVQQKQNQKSRKTVDNIFILEMALLSLFHHLVFT